MFLFGVFFSLLIGELAVRKFIKMPLRKEYMIFRCLGYKKIPAEMQVKGLLWEPSFKTSPTREKKDGVFRIICIGDSVTEGYFSGSRLKVYPYPSYLEQIVNKESLSKKIEVINAGSGGYSSHQGLVYLKQRLLKFNPDLVISWFGINDAGDSFFYPDKKQKLSKDDDENKRTILERSHLYLLIKNFSLLMNEVKSQRPRVAPEDFYKNCEEMLQIAKGNNFEIVFIIPFKIVREKHSIKHIDWYKKALLILADKYACEVLDVAGYFPRYDIADSFVDACHANSKGNKVIARIIYNLLKGKLETLINDNRNNIIKENKKNIIL